MAHDHIGFPWRLTCKDYRGWFTRRADAEVYARRMELTGCQLEIYAEDRDEYEPVEAKI